MDPMEQYDMPPLRKYMPYRLTPTIVGFVALEFRILLV